MCMPSGPAAPKPIDPPQAPNDPKLADLTALRKQRQVAGSMAGGSLLTGPTGIQNNQLNLGRGSLLGS